MNLKYALLMGFSILFSSHIAMAGKTISFKDPKKDDYGPGSYVYPTSHEYKKGSFDIRSVTISDKGDKIEIEVKLGAKIKDPWNSKEWQGNGFSLQFGFLFIDTDHKKGSGNTISPPGLNVFFKPEQAWDKVVLISPQSKTRLTAEINSKAKALKDSIVIPQKTYSRGKKLISIVAKKDIGKGAIDSWGYQLAMQSNEGYPAPTDLLTRKVNEYEGQHRFGGGNDYNCDPHALDILAGKGEGANSEKEAQKAALAYKCKPDGSSEKKAIIPMLYKK